MSQAKGILLAIAVVVAASWLQLYARTTSDQIIAVDLAVLLGEHKDATEKGPDALEAFAEKWGNRKLLVHGYVISVGPWGYYELGTTPDQETASVAMFSPGKEFLKADVQKRSHVSVQCRSVLLFPHYVMFTDTIFMQIRRPEIR